MKYLGMDIETTGIGMKCQVIEVGAVIDDLFAPGIKLLDLPQFHCYVDWPLLQGEPYAFHMHGQNNLLKRLSEKSSKYTFYYPKQVWPAFCNWLFQASPRPFNKYDQINVAGKNFGYFDANRLEQLPNWPGPYNGGKSIWAHKFIDLGNLLWNPWEDIETLPNMKKVKQRCGLGSSISHTAIDDALDVIRAMRVWMKSNRSRQNAPSN